MILYRRVVGVRDLGDERVVGVGVGEEGADGEEGPRDGQRGAPLLLEDVEANAAVRVDVRVLIAKNSANSSIPCLLYRYKLSGCTGTTSAKQLNCSRVGSCTGTGARVPVQEGRESSCCVLFSSLSRLGYSGELGWRIRRRHRATEPFELVFDAGVARGGQASGGFRRICCRSGARCCRARTRRRSIGLRRDLVRWIRNFERNPRNLYFFFETSTPGSLECIYTRAGSPSGFLQGRSGRFGLLGAVRVDGGPVSPFWRQIVPRALTCWLLDHFESIT
uniref:Uncharacterized protein n=1 Tax=Ananas comosus var. bracteatus TaxID=296719 RepID=A0A6V7PKI6_ANACO|nr:unnamed protein product [Ananas comosus var. bracteatus]